MCIARLAIPDFVNFTFHLQHALKMGLLAGKLTYIQWLVALGFQFSQLSVHALMVVMGSFD